MLHANFGGWVLILVVTFLVVLPAVVRLALAAWAETVEAYWKMRTRVRNAPAKAEQEIKENIYSRR